MECNKIACKRFVAIHSDNDPYVSISQGDILKEKLAATLIIKHNMGNITAPEFPDVLNPNIGIFKVRI